VGEKRHGRSSLIGLRGRKRRGGAVDTMALLKRTVGRERKEQNKMGLTTLHSAPLKKRAFDKRTFKD